MSKLLLPAVLALSTSAWAQSADAGTPEPAPTQGEVEELKKDLSAAQKQLTELQEELRAQLATKSVAEGWQETWVEERRKLELFIPDGYFRLRPELFHNLDLNREADPSGYTLFPQSPVSGAEKTQAWVNMRFRFEPTLNVSEEVRVRMQIDALDNLVFGSTPDSSREYFTIFSNSQSQAADSIRLKRVYGEVSTPVGILRGGRMGSHWGTGMLWNDGNCLECDDGVTVDRLMFVTEPLTGYFITPMLDFNAEGPVGAGASGVPLDLANSDDSHSYILAFARRDTEQQAQARLDNGQAVLNYGVHFTYRIQKYDLSVPEGQGLQYIRRDGSLYIPTVWAKYERKSFQIEFEGAGVFGSIGNRALSASQADTPGANQSLSVVQFGAVLKGEYRLVEGSLKLGLEIGVASGDKEPGMGNDPRRRTGDSGGGNNTLPGDIDGPQYACSDVSCSDNSGLDNSIRNFRFNKDYRIDLILWREILGQVTDAIYVRPTIKYRVAEGFDLFGALIYSRAIYGESTPSNNGTSFNADLGIELNAGARYESEDGFFAELQWGILFPLGGLEDKRTASQQEVESAQALRGLLGITF